MIDGRGTALRSRAFHTASYGKVETASNLDDHIAGTMSFPPSIPQSTHRVGIIGFSAGGYMTASAMLRYPDFFVGIAAAITTNASGARASATKGIRSATTTRSRPT